MEITIEHFEAIVILLYKIEEYEACEALFDVLKKLQTHDDRQCLRLIKSDDIPN